MLLRFRKACKRSGNARNQQVGIREPGGDSAGAKQRKLLAAKTFAYTNAAFAYANLGRSCHPFSRRASAVPASFAPLAPSNFVESPRAAFTPSLATAARKGCIVGCLEFA